MRADSSFLAALDACFWARYVFLVSDGKELLYAVYYTSPEK